MNPKEKEDLRHSVLEILANREGTALTARAVCRRAATEIDFKITEDDIEITLGFLKGLDLCKFTPDGLGSTKHWQITTAGVLAYERGQIPAPPHSAE